MIIRKIKLEMSKRTMPKTEAPSTLRMPISFVRRFVTYDVSAKSPMQEIQIVINPNKPTIFANLLPIAKYESSRRWLSIYASKGRSEA